MGQHEGEIVFLPANWWHSTENLGWSFAFGFQGSNDPTHRPDSDHRLMAQAVIGNAAAMEGADLHRNRDVLAAAAFANGHVEVVKLLHDKARLSKDQLKEGLTFAALNAHAPLFRWLMQKTLPKKTPLPKWAMRLAHLAVFGGSEEILTLILDARASVHMPDDEDGQLPLHVAAIGGHARLVQLLPERRAKKNFPNSDGKTPLQLASKTSAAHALVRRLLESGPVRQRGEL